MSAPDQVPHNAPAASRRLALRERTAAAHAELDRLVGRLDDMDRYAGYLRGMLIFRGSVEATLPGSLEIGWQLRALACAIRADLADLGLITPTITVRPALHLHLADRSSLLGILYVLEGASLGARLLYREAQTLGLSESHGARHLALQAAHADSWRSFLALLERGETFDLDRAADAALATFALAHGALEAPR